MSNEMEDLRSMPAEVIEKKGDALRVMVKTLERQLSEAAPPEQIKQWILDLCQANDIKMDRSGNQYETPNWSARDRGLERIFQILKLETNSDAKGHGNMPAKISIQIIDNRPQAQP